MLAVPLVVQGGALALWFVVADHGRWRPRHVAGLALLIPAAVLWVSARLALGDAFTPRAEARRLVTSGPYARLRHPIYVAGECMSVGTFLFMGWRWLLLASLLLAVPLQVWRARREARVLDAAFGDAYRAYRRRTWF